MMQLQQREHEAEQANNHPYHDRDDCQSGSCLNNILIEQYEEGGNSEDKDNNHDAYDSPKHPRKPFAFLRFIALMSE